MIESGSQEISCDNCGEKIAAYADGRLTIFPSKSADLHEIPIEWIFEAVKKGKGKGMMKLREFVDSNTCIFG
jgi:hypothetical protein